jgi:hypothetical protein
MGRGKDGRAVDLLGLIRHIFNPPPRPVVSLAISYPLITSRPPFHYYLIIAFCRHLIPIYGAVKYCSLNIIYNKTMIVSILIELVTEIQQIDRRRRLSQVSQA